MKNLKACAFAALFSFGCINAFAQDTPPVNEPDYNKPKAFADLPDKLTLHTADLEALLTTPVGTTVNIAIANGFVLKGTVMSASAHTNNSWKSVVVKSEARQGAVFALTRITNSDGTFVYRGRMLGKASGDALEIAKEGTGYVLRKKGYYDVINE